MDMTISAVQLGASSQPQAKTSDTGFSDVLTEVRTASPQVSDYASMESRSFEQAQPAEAVQAEIPEDVAVQTELADVSFTAEFEQTVISLITKETGITPEDSEEMGRVIDALLEILKKMNGKSEDDTAVNMVMELLAAMLGETEGAPAVDFSFRQSETAITAVNTEISAEITAILSTETVAPVQTADAAPAQFADAASVQTDAPAETEIPAETAPKAETSQPADTYEKLLNDILNEARKDLGLTKAEFTRTQAPAEAEISTQTAKESAGAVLHLNHKDGTNELNSILGNTADEPEAKQETVIPVTQDNSAALAGNTLARAETVPAETEIKVEIPLPEQQIADEILSKPEAVNGGRTEFTMELNPESLGKITVRLVSTEGRVEVNITAENDATRQLLESRADNIGAALRSNGVELERYQVVSGQEEAQLMQESYDGSSKNPYGRNDEEQQNNEDGENDFLEILQQL